jgi:hypothetical protein
MQPIKKTGAILVVSQAGNAINESRFVPFDDRACLCMKCHVASSGRVLSGCLPMVVFAVQFV